MDGAQVVLHVGADVGVGRGEGRVPHRHVGGQADQGDVRDHRASRQSMGSARGGGKKILIDVKTQERRFLTVSRKV